MTVNYQNPATVNLVLDSETVGTDATTGQPLVREFIIPIEKKIPPTVKETVTQIQKIIMTALHKNYKLHVQNNIRNRRQEGVNIKNLFVRRSTWTRKTRTQFQDEIT